MEATLFHLRVSVNETFGYGHLPRSFIENNSIDIQSLVNENGWIAEPGVLTVSFHRSRSSTINWSAIKNKKDLKAVVKETKKKR